MKISELRPGGQIELQAEVVSLGSIRKIYKCFECEDKGLWKTETEFQDKCPSCGALESDKPRVGVWIQQIRSIQIKDDSGSVYLDLWNDHIDDYEVGDKIHLINGFARENGSGGVNVSSGKYGTIKKEKS
jgi:DNA-directed RNA polymerase subunit RPC12/RpoP